MKSEWTWNRATAWELGVAECPKHWGQLRPLLRARRYSTVSGRKAATSARTTWCVAYPPKVAACTFLLWLLLGPSPARLASKLVWLVWVQWPAEEWCARLGATRFGTARATRQNGAFGTEVRSHQFCRFPLVPLWLGAGREPPSHPPREKVSAT
jgi:hypothetical protein